MVKAEESFLPPLHFRLNLMKNVVKAMDQNGSQFLYLKQNIRR